MNDFRKIYEEIETVKENVRFANKTEVAADLPTCHRYDMPSEETEAVKEETSIPMRDRKTREKKAERKTDQFSLLNAVILSFLIHGDKFVEILYHSTTRREFSFKIYPENMVV